MEGYRGKPRRDDVRREIWEVQDRSTRKDRKKRHASAKNQGEIEETLGDVRGIKRRMAMKRYLHDPMDFAKTLKLRFRVGDLDLPERRKRYTRSREEEEIDAQICPCGEAIESRSDIVGECEMYKE